MTKAEFYSKIAEECILQLLGEYEKNPYNFFSESDVKCRLFTLLFQNKDMRAMSKTIDGKLTRPLHTEIAYFDDEGRLVFRVDLSAVDPAYTDVYGSLKHGRIRLAKGYRADVCYFAIELKFNKRSKKENMLRIWEEDMMKLVDIKTRNPYLTCFSVLLDKKNNAIDEKELQDIKTKYPGIKIAYSNMNGQYYLGNF